MNAQSPIKRSIIDELYASRPDTRPALLWPVSDNPFTMRPVQWFDSFGEAADFVSASLGRVNYFIGEPKRRRA